MKPKITPGPTSTPATAPAAAAAPAATPPAPAAPTTPATPPTAPAAAPAPATPAAPPAPAAPVMPAVPEATLARPGGLGGDVSFDPAAIGQALQRSQGLLVALAIIGLTGFTGYQISRDLTAQPDQAYLAQQQTSQKVPSLKFNKATLDKLRNLQSGGSTSIQVPVGKTDPFTLP